MMNMPFVTIVSGLPRSGTSLMMQVLDAGGMPVLTDNIRQSDEDNPKGYYEYEPVKKLKSDSSWLSNAVGKAVKMIYPHLYDLPRQYQYRVIFMTRHMEEVVASQKAMLGRMGPQKKGAPDDMLADLFNRDLEKIQQWLTVQDHFDTMSIDYGGIIKSPVWECQRIQDFLGIPLSIDKMASVVCPSLYRNRKSV